VRVQASRVDDSQSEGMKSVQRHRFLLCASLCLLVFCLLAQQPRKANAPVTGKSRVFLLHADVLTKSADNPDPDAQVLIGNVRFRHDSVYMYCDSACFFEKKNAFEAFDNVKMVQGDTLFLYGDYLYYDGNTQLASVRYNVKMENETTTLLTDSLNYDRVSNVGYFFEGGTLKDEENTLNSSWGEYSPETKVAVFNYDVKLVNPKFTLTSDTLRYSTATKIANIVGPSNIDNGKNHIYSDLGYYTTTTGQAELLNRSVWTNDRRRMTGDSLFYDRGLAYGEAFGNVVFTDEVNKNMMMGEYCYYSDSLAYGFCTDKALAVDYSQGDSLFLHADTLKLYTFNNKTDSLYRETHAYNKVRVFRKDIQAVCDSMVFSSKDSCLRMYHDPVLWNQQQQLLGEEIHVFMNDSTIERANIHDQALSVEQVDSANYNQVKGKDINAYFRAGEVYRVDAIGSVKVVFFPLEKDSTVLLMNVSTTSELNVYVANRKMERMVMKPAAEGTMYPLFDAPAKERFLDTFAWLDAIRPKSKDDVFIWQTKNADQQLKKSTRGAVVLPNQDLFGTSTEKKK